MIIDDQIREAAKISPLSSGKINKYKYITGEKILPSNQQQMIEKAKFTYSPLGEAFEKQIKTIEDQGEKQIKAFKDQRHIKTIKKCDYDDEDSPLILKQKEIFNELADEKLNKITELDKKVNCNGLVCKYKGRSHDEHFNGYDNALDLIDETKNGKIELSAVKK